MLLQEGKARGAQNQSDQLGFVSHHRPGATRHVGSLDPERISNTFENTLEVACDETSTLPSVSAVTCMSFTVSYAEEVTCPRHVLYISRGKMPYHTPRVAHGSSGLWSLRRHELTRKRGRKLRHARHVRRMVKYASKSRACTSSCMYRLTRRTRVASGRSICSATNPRMTSACSIFWSAWIIV